MPRFRTYFYNGVLFALCFGTNSLIYAQDTIHADTNSVVLVPKKHSPLRASIYSTLIPGLGQIYNKKYWKLPIIYGGMGFFIYNAGLNRTDYLWLKEGYVNRLLEKEEDPFLAQYSTDGIKSAMDAARQNMEWSYIGAGVLYILNIVDASVDAHLYTFDMSDDLSLRVEPVYMPLQAHQSAFGFQLKLRF